jgi:hypothetical protein
MNKKPIRRFPRLDLSKLSIAEQRELLIGVCRQHTDKLRALKSSENVLPLIAMLFDAVLFLENLRQEETT